MLQTHEEPVQASVNKTDERLFAETELAIEAYRQAEDSIPADDPRGDLRREKIASAVASAKSASERN